jgi:hypothetical protein
VHCLVLWWLFANHAKESRNAPRIPVRDYPGQQACVEGVFASNLRREQRRWRRLRHRRVSGATVERMSGLRNSVRVLHRDDWATGFLGPSPVDWVSVWRLFYIRGAFEVLETLRTSVQCRTRSECMQATLSQAIRVYISHIVAGAV